MMAIGGIVFSIVVFCLLAFKRAALVVWSILFGVILLSLMAFSHQSELGWWMLWGAIFLPLLIQPLRRYLFSRPIFSVYRRLMPSMSTTEKEALAAGDVGFEGQILSGMPDWFGLRAVPKGTLSAEEQAFLSGPVEILCGMISNWEVNHQHHTIPSEIWQYLKQQGFLGLIIPPEYGGKGFSALAHSQIVTKVAGVSVAVATSLSVPNSLGPGELLLHYGTPEQKKYYLPRLASGEIIPCFALTSPQAGSDAAAIEDYGVVVEREINGVMVRGLLLNWNKRYITLAPVATLLGLAFKLYDPEHLLSAITYRGITCALIPVSTPGVVIGHRRHDPLHSHFPNGPTQGQDVFIPLDHIIGGEAMIGAGWRMLMECLAAGRAISLPAMATGSVKQVVYATGAYARIRRQFNTHIGSFEGIQAVLARIGAKAYLVESLRLFNVTSIDRGIKSAVSSAICKYHATENARQIVNDGMDIHGGKGICMGPHNYLAQAYIEAPISITVEGANILTRSLIIFGQGVIRSHPFVLTEMMAAERQDAIGLRDFDRALFSHMGMVISNAVRTVVLACTSGYGAAVPPGVLKRYYQHFSRFSAAFALVSDVAMLRLGASLKRREDLSGRLGDMLSLVYMGAAAIKYYELENNYEAWPVVEWLCQDLLYRLQNTMHEFLLNFPSRGLSRVLRIMIFPWGRRFNPPADMLGAKIASLLLNETATRQRLTQHLYTGIGQHHNPIADVQKAFSKIIGVESLWKRLQHAEKSGEIVAMHFEGLVQAAVHQHVLTAQEAEQLLHVHALCMKVINVDDFSVEQND